VPLLTCRYKHVFARFFSRECIGRQLWWPQPNYFFDIYLQLNQLGTSTSAFAQ
jgi:hypothetical protein